MQLSGLLVLLVLGALLAHPWIAAAATMAHIYSVGLAGWDEDADLHARFGDDWTRYHTEVRRWLPRWRPWVWPGTPPARLYVSHSCDQCSHVGRWFAAHQVMGLVIVAAETHPSQSLTRMQYEGPDGHVASGVDAMVRAWEHLHFGWAMAGACIRLPGVRHLAQLLVDASGGGPRTVTGGVQRRRGGVGDAASGVSHISRRGTAKS